MTKREHFLPRAAYLRRFSNTNFSDDRKNKLIGYDKNTGKLFETNVADACVVKDLYESNLFGKENEVEELFSEMENDLKTFYDEIIEQCKIHDNSSIFSMSEKNISNFKFSLIFQLFRTRARYVETIKLFNGDEECAKNSFLFQILGMDENGKFGIVHYIDEFCKDGIVTVGINCTQLPFIISDDPVILDGSEEKPLLLRMPLNPYLQVYIINPGHPHFSEQKKYAGKVLFLHDVCWIKYWNKRCYDSALQFVYLTPGFNLEECIL